MEKCDRLLKWVMAGVILLFIIYVSLFLYHIHLAYPVCHTSEFNTFTDSIKTSLVSNNDSLMNLYISKIDTLTHEAIRKVDHYETSVDLMIDKANNWIGFWVGILSLLLTISTILQVWRNYQSNVSYDNRIKEMKSEWEKEKNVFYKEIEKSLENVEQVKRELQQTSVENQIITIANCLSNCPDPVILSQSEKHRSYAKFYLKQLYFAYDKYVFVVSELLTDRTSNRRDCTYNQEDYISCTDRVVSVLHTINSNISKVLVLFANVNQYLELYLFTNEVTVCSEKLMKKGVSREELVERLKIISLKFNQWIKTMDNPS